MTSPGEPHDQELLKQGIKDRLKAHVAAGYHLRDACELEQVSFSYVIANMGDPEFQRMYDVSRGREIVCAGKPAPAAYTPSMARDATLRLFILAGIPDKLAIMGASADPLTEDGRKVLYKLMPLLSKLLPTAAEVTEKQEKDVSTEELEAELKKLRQLQEPKDQDQN